MFEQADLQPGEDHQREPDHEEADRPRRQLVPVGKMGKGDKPYSSSQGRGVTPTNKCTLKRGKNRRCYKMIKRILGK